MSAIDETQRHRQMIERQLESHGLGHSGWRMDEADHREQALLGRWTVMEDYDDLGLCADDEGDLVATVVGATEYGNERVIYSFTADGCDSGSEVRPYEEVEPV